MNQNRYDEKKEQIKEHQALQGLLNSGTTDPVRHLVGRGDACLD